MLKSLMVAAASAVLSFAYPLDGARPDGGGAKGAIWLSDVSPRASSGRPEMSGSGYGRPAGFKVWVLTGDPATRGRCVPRATGVVDVYDNDGRSVGAEAVAARGCTTVKVAAAGAGRYTLYYTTGAVRGGVRYVSIAKSDTSHGRHGDKVVMRDGMTARTSFEIVRLPLEDEGLFTHFASGDTLTFRTLFNGEPKAGVRLLMTTSEGWSRQAFSDENGTAAFTLIKEYFPAWDRFDKRHRDGFVLQAFLTVPEGGSGGNVSYAETRYAASYAGAFYPESEGYLSYAYALLFATAALLLSGIFVYIYRRRRVKPYTEVRFDEKD